MAWDERGRLYVSVTAIIPFRTTGNSGEGRDKILSGRRHRQEARRLRSKSRVRGQAERRDECASVRGG